jgi:hypothetical protein
MLLKSEIEINQPPKKYLHFTLAGENVSISLSTPDYALSKIEPVKSGKFFVYKDRIYISNPLENKNTDEILKAYDIFVEREDNILDTEPKTWNEYIGQTAFKETMQETFID